MGNVLRSSTPSPRGKGTDQHLAFYLPLPLLPQSPLSCVASPCPRLFLQWSWNWTQHGHTANKMECICVLSMCLLWQNAVWLSICGAASSVAWLFLLAWVCGDSTLSAIAVEVSWWQQAEAACRAVSQSWCLALILNNAAAGSLSQGDVVDGLLLLLLWFSQTTHFEA